MEKCADVDARHGTICCVLYMVVMTAATKTATWSTNERTHASNVEDCYTGL